MVALTRIVLAHTGDFETSLAIPWLRDKHGAEVIALTVDLGRARDLNRIRERAMAMGAIRCHVLDARDEFARDYILPALQADALDEQGRPQAAALGRALLAKKLIDIAHMEGARVIAHGGSGTTCIDVSAPVIDPDISVLAPAREWTRAEAVDFARARSIPVPLEPVAFSIDHNLWGRSFAWRGTPDASQPLPHEVYTPAKSAADAAAPAAFVEIEWRSGAPAAINGVEMPLVDLIDSLETIAGVHGVGRAQAAELHRGGLVTHVAIEAPAAVVLHSAHQTLESMVTAPDLERLKQPLSHEYARIIDNGKWCSPARSAIDAFVHSMQAKVTGVVRMKLDKGQCHVVECASPFGTGDERTAGAAAPAAPGTKYQ